MNNTGITPIPNSVTRTLVCVEDTTACDFSGVLYNPYMPQSVAFGQAKDIITALDTFFTDIGYPQSYFEDRSFLGGKHEGEAKQPVPVQRYMQDDIFGQHRGAVATFEVEVRSRMNASWQGTFFWLDREQQCAFRSTLELIKLMDGVVNGDGIPEELAQGGS